MNNMNNKQLFRAALDKRGISITQVAARMGVTTNTLYSKLDGTHDWKLSELDVLQKELSINTIKIEGGFRFENIS